MSQAISRSDLEQVFPDAGPEEDPPPSDSMRRAARFGWAIIILFFGVFGTWAVTAPLNGAVVSNAVVKVMGNRKSVQHLDGGIVKRMMVKEGDRVQNGQVLIVLDDTQARAEVDVLAQQYFVARATEIRLLAELERKTELTLPPDLAARLEEPWVRTIWNGQLKQFESRRDALEGQRRVIQERVAQLQSQITGSQGQERSYRAQADSVRGELTTLMPLVEKGYITRTRILQLERGLNGLDGQIAEASSAIAKFRQAIAEQQQQIAQLENDRMKEITQDLREAQARSLDLIPKLMNAQAVLGRMDIRSPYTGKVVALNVFSVGGVIGRGEKILDVVPDEGDLVVEAQIAVEDISELRPGMRAEVHLTSYKQRIVPMMHGEVIHVSADRLTDPKTNLPYYTAQVQMDKDELAASPNIVLYPGMPAQVMIPTQERTAFDYLVGPLVVSFNQAFRQR